MAVQRKRQRNRSKRQNNFMNSEFVTVRNLTAQFKSDCFNNICGLFQVCLPAHAVAVRLKPQNFEMQATYNATLCGAIRQVCNDVLFFSRGSTRASSSSRKYKRIGSCDEQKQSSEPTQVNFICLLIEFDSLTKQQTHNICLAVWFYVKLLFTVYIL